jgi:hypothetical protein
MSATLCRNAAPVFGLIGALLTAAPAFAQDRDHAPAQQNEHRAAETVKFITGAAIAFAAHEGGHLVFDVAFDAAPRVKAVHFGPIPFFAVAHRADLSPRREFTVSSAGFWVQEAGTEWLLTRRPALRDEHAPLAKGLLAFNVLTSVGYGAVALAEAGPFERDTRGMAASVGVSERAIGVVVMAPALLDAYRYFHPASTWAKWTSRAVKVGSVLLVLKGR